MSKNKSGLELLGNVYLMYKFSGVILALLGAFVIICIFAIPKMDKEYQKYGYTGYTDKIMYDSWTGEIIPKQEIATWNSSEKYITNSKGEQITFGQMQELLNEYEAIQGNYYPIREKNIDRLDEICNTLLREYLDLNYEIKKIGNEEGRYQIVIKGEYEGTYYSKIVAACDIQGLVKEVAKDKYRSQNGLEKKE